MSRRPKPSATATPAIKLTAHPPERARQRGSVTLPVGCCCCCCCCLHTLGGLIGGIVGSISPLEQTPRPVDPDFPFPFRRDELDEPGPLLPATLLYWLLVSFLMGVGTVWMVVQNGLQIRRDLPVEMLMVFALFLPLFQLGASGLAVIGVTLFYSDRRAGLVRIGKITLWSFVGALIGLFLMLGLCGMGGLLR
jgi:hypothetical protein